MTPQRRDAITVAEAAVVVADQVRRLFDIARGPTDTVPSRDETPDGVIARVRAPRGWRACGRTDAHLCPSHAPEPTCRHCEAPTAELIRGDGGMTLVCPPCVRALARIAADPLSAHPDVVARQFMASMDVVALFADPGELRWAWTGSWETGRRLVRGGVA